MAKVLFLTWCRHVGIAIGAVVSSAAETESWHAATCCAWETTIYDFCVNTLRRHFAPGSQWYLSSDESDFYKTVLFNYYQLGRRTNIKLYRFLPKYPMFHSWSIVRGFVLEGEKLNMVYTEIS